MKADELQLALDLVKGPTGTDQSDLVEMSSDGIRTADGMWWAQTDNVLFPSMVVLPFDKFRKIIKTIPGDEEVILKVESAHCTIACTAAKWKLNVREASIPEQPEPESQLQVDKIQGEGVVESSGYELATAIKALKHVARTDLTRPGLLSAWANEQEELIIGDGTRLGGHACGVANVQIPLLAALEIARILTTKPSETLTWREDNRLLCMEHSCGKFLTLKPAAPFEVDWYHRVLELLENKLGECTVSKSELERALTQVMVSPGTGIKLTQSTKGLVLETQEESGEKSTSSLEKDGDLGLPALAVDAKNFQDAVSSMGDEMITITVCEKVIKIHDSDGWEVLPRKEAN